MKKKILLGLLAILVIIQFFGIDKSNPQSDPNADFLHVTNAPENVKQYLKNACYDCHSNHTAYPWYTNVAPVSFWIRGHIKNARANTNYSEWTTQYDDKGRSHKIQETIEKIELGHMPPKSYKWMHSEARINDEQKTEVLNWLKSLN
jgi:uncharacterized protein YxeA